MTFLVLIEIIGVLNINSCFKMSAMKSLLCSLVCYTNHFKHLELGIVCALEISSETQRKTRKGDKMTRFVIINTMDAVDVFRGKVISVHHSLEAAMENDSKIQRACKRANGDSSYMPTVICEIDSKRPRIGDWVRKDEANRVQI